MTQNELPSPPLSFVNNVLSEENACISLSPRPAVHYCGRALNIWGLAQSDLETELDLISNPF